MATKQKIMLTLTVQKEIEYEIPPEGADSQEDNDAEEAATNAIVKVFEDKGWNVDVTDVTFL